MALKVKPRNQSHRSHTVDEAIEEAGREDTKNVILRLPESKHKKFKVKATSNDQSLQKILEAAVDKYIKD